jgi:very-short-patch-repair endonuclease
MTERLVTLARKLRRESTDAERLIWKYLKSKKLSGFKFRRQEPIGKYIADFVCFENKIIIEIDGSQHNMPVNRMNDEERTRWLKGRGFRVLRFWNSEVLKNMDGVWETILRHCESPSP